MRKHLGWTAFVFTLLLVTTPAVYADKVLQLKSANYDPGAGVWMDSSGNGNDAVATDSPPALNPGQTVNGSAVVTFDGTNFLTMTPGISAAGFTCFAYVRPNSGDSRTIVGGNTGSFQYRIGGDGFGDMQEVLQRNLVRLGVSNTNVSTANFSIISVTYGSGGSFRLAEMGDGSPVSLLFSAPTNLIGAASGPNEFYNGDIAEIRLYNAVLSDADRAAIEEEIRLTYEPM
jgi:Concanavalin A-like lectin/glucanases superfamily